MPGMRALVTVLLAVGASTVLAGRPDVGRSLLQTATCNVATGCTACPDGCATSPGSCIGSTPGNYRCRRCTQVPTNQVPTTQTEPWVNRVPQVDGSCGCAPGYYMKKVTLNSVERKICEICPVGSYCPGGTETVQKDDTANKKLCSAINEGLTTRNRGASNPLVQCVNKPGYSFTAPNDNTDGNPGATKCIGNTFSVGLRKQPTCTTCPGNLRLNKGLNDNENIFPSDRASDIPTVPASGTGTILPAYVRVYTADGAPATGADSATLCLVPPGFFAVNNKVMRCPKGEYRADYVALGISASRCLLCPRGSTTYGSGSTSLKHCDQLLPGFYWGAALTRSERPTSGAGNGPVTFICDQNFYCPGGYATNGATPDGKIACPRKMWTKATGARALSDCMVPPGHYLPSTPDTSEVTACSAGEYFPDWRINSAAALCTACGSGISSEAVELVPTFEVSTTDGTVTQKTRRVARSSASCFIEAGDSIVQAGGNATNPKFRKVVCSGRNYGVPTKQYGLRLTPCTECPEGTVTTCTSSNTYRRINGGFYDPRACCTLPGWGYTGDKASLCSKGFYNDGTLDPADSCKPCPAGRTTQSVDVAGNRDERSDCSLTLPGFGWQSTSSFTMDSETTLEKCPRGTYSGGDVTIANGNCVDCGSGRTTRNEGAVETTDCDVCPVGKGSGGGNDNGNAAGTVGTCGLCKEGFYGDDSRAENSFGCVACPTTPSTFTFYYGGNSGPVEVTATTESGAASVQQCVARFAPIVDVGNWYIRGASATKVDSYVVNSVTILVDSAATCMAACAVEAECQFYTYDYKTPACLHRKRASTDKDDAMKKVAFKTLAAVTAGVDETSSRRAGNSTKRASNPAAVGSGVWSWWNDQSVLVSSTIIGWSSTDYPSPPTTVGTATVENCLNACNDNEECAAVYFVFTAVASETTPTKDSTVACTFIRGKVTTPTDGDDETVLRSMIKYRAATTDRPSWL